MRSICAACGGHDMREEKRDLSRRYKGEAIVIKAMPGRYCANCGEAEFLTTADGDRFAAEVQRAMQAIDHGRRTELLPATEAPDAHAHTKNDWPLTGGQAAQYVVA